MKNTLITFALSVVTLLSTTLVAAQDFQDELDPVFLSKNMKVTSYQQVNDNLIEKGTFSFSKEIKAAKISKGQVSFSAEKEPAAIPTTVYLKTLRKAGNRSENPQEFHAFLAKNMEAFPVLNENENGLEQLYHVVRNNTFEGKLDKVGATLTWLK